MFLRIEEACISYRTFKFPIEIQIFPIDIQARAAENSNAWAKHELLFDIGEVRRSAYELVRLDLAGISPTPLSPRRNFGTDHEKIKFGEECGRSSCPPAWW